MGKISKNSPSPQQPDKQAGGQRALPQDVLPVALAYPLKAEGHFLVFVAGVDKVEGDMLLH